MLWAHQFANMFFASALGHTEIGVLITLESTLIMMSLYRSWLCQLRLKTNELSREDLELEVDVPGLISDIDALDQHLKFCQETVHAQASWQRLLLQYRWRKGLKTAPEHSGPGSKDTLPPSVHHTSSLGASLHILYEP